MQEFRGTLSQKGLASFNQALFDNMACFLDVVWVIDLASEAVEILLDNVEPKTVNHSYTLEEIRERISNRYPGQNRSIVNRYTVEYLSTLKETAYYYNPTFVYKSRRFKLRQSLTPEIDEQGNVIRVYVTAINTQNFVNTKDYGEIYKTVSMILSHAKDFEQGVNDTLKYLGDTLNISKAYIFENDPDDPAYCNNTFEWCAEDVQPAKDAMQHISYAEYGFDQIFSQAQLYCCSNVAEINDTFMREMFEGQGIRAFMNYAFYDHDTFAGFVGIEDNRMSRLDWDLEHEEVEILTFVSDLLTTYLIKERNLIKAREEAEAVKELRKKDQENQVLLSHFVKAYTSAYSVALKDRTFEILHMAHDFQQVFTMDGNLDDMARFVENHVHPDDRPMARKMTDPDYIRGRLRTEQEINFTLREEYADEERIMHVTIMRGADADNCAIGFLDVTAEMQAEKEINEQLRRANNAKRDFLSAMSHDIRTPMNAIIGMVDIALRNTDNPEKMVDSLHKIRTSGNQLISLVNDVLDISAIESGKTELRPAPHNVEEGMLEKQATIAGILNGKKLNVEFLQHDILHPWIIIDELRLEQIINNLLSNAIKYTPEGGSVCFESYQDVDDDGTLWGVIKVSDTGIGMSEEYMKHMWDTFSRATDTRVNKIQGAGLGLSIVKNFVDLMGGNISVESELDKGSTFTVRIPCEAVREEDIPQQVSTTTNENLALNILVAEDNDLNWEIANDLLGMNGITCTRAENGQLAVDAFLDAAPGTFDAILMDMQMPVMDGLEAAAAIRSAKHPEAKTIPILAVTANAFVEDMEACKEAGMNDHLSKPIDIQKVLAALQKYTQQ